MGFWIFILFILGLMIAFTASLVCYVREKGKPQESFSAERLTTYKIVLIVSAVILGLILAAFIALFALLMTAVAFM